MEDRFYRPVIDGTVRIRFEGGVLLLPARSPYEWETVLGHVLHRLRRDGHVCLEMNGHRCDVRATDMLAEVEDCGFCGRALERFACRVGPRTLCLGCVHDGTLSDLCSRTKSGQAPLGARTQQLLTV